MITTALRKGELLQIRFFSLIRLNSNAYRSCRVNRAVRCLSDYSGTRPSTFFAGHTALCRASTTWTKHLPSYSPSASIMSSHTGNREMLPMFVNPSPVTQFIPFVSGSRVCRRGVHVPAVVTNSPSNRCLSTKMTLTPPPASTSTETPGATSTSTETKFKLPDPLPVSSPLQTLGHTMKFVPKDRLRRFATSFRLFRQIRGRLAKGSVLTARLSGDLPERAAPTLPFSPPNMTFSMLLDALRLGAYDPRISHLHLRIDPLSCGWGKIFELRRHIDFFAASGKTVSAFMEVGGPKEYFIAMGYALYVPPDGSLNLRGFMASGAFVRGVLDKIGISPQVERIGNYKSAGDQLARTDMAPEQRETLNAILEDVYTLWTESVHQAVGISKEDLDGFLDRSPWDMEEYVKAKLISGTCYESELIDGLKRKFNNGGKPMPETVEDTKGEEEFLKKKLQSVDVVKYTRRTTARLLAIEGDKKVAVIRAIGAITPGKSRMSATGNFVGSDTLVELIRRARFDKRIVGVLLRIDSPGGAALASDIVWNELRALRKVKPVVASQGDVAASGGYYLSMACEVVSEPLTLTGSIGVVTAKPSLQRLYERIGYNKENLSIGGRYAQLLVDDRPFSEEESKYFREGAELAYDKFVRKAAESRGKSLEDMQMVAQGRVWTGRQAHERGLVDYIGGTSRALEVLKERCEVKGDFLKVEELKSSMSFAERFGVGGSSVDHDGMNDMSAFWNQPLALADVDPALGQQSPLSMLLVSTAVAPLLRSFASTGLTQWRDLAMRLLKVLLE